MSMTYTLPHLKVEKNIPVPVNVKSMYPFKEMKVGDSFFVPLGETTEGCWRARIKSAARMAEVYTRISTWHEDFVSVGRPIGSSASGLRVWVTGKK